MLPAAAQAMTFDQAVNKLVSHGWAKKMEKQVISFKGNALGYRSGGTAADDACARWIAGQFRAIGLSDVALEAVPVDEWDFKSASVQVSGLGYSNPLTYKATGFGGGVPTPTAGVTGEVVYVKDVDLLNGPWSGSAGAFDAVGDVTGKIVVVDFESAMWWMSLPDMEAGLRGAAAVILTYNPDWPGYYGQEDALAAFDAETDLSAPPMVWIPWKSGDGLKEALEGRRRHRDRQAQRADEAHRRRRQGLQRGRHAQGHDQQGRVRGLRRPSRRLVPGRPRQRVFGRQQPRHRQGDEDEPLPAQAQRGVPQHHRRGVRRHQQLVRLVHRRLELHHAAAPGHGRARSRACSTPRSSATRRATSGCWPAPRSPRCSNDQIAASGDLTLTRNDTAPAVIGQPWCWNDQWTFTAAGVPSVSFWSQDNDYSGAYKTTIYHTQYDTASLINYPFLGDISKFEFRVAKKFDRGLLPYSLRHARTTSTAALHANVVAGDVTSPTVGDVIADPPRARPTTTSRRPSAASPRTAGRVRLARRSTAACRPPTSRRSTRS